MRTCDYKEGFQERVVRGLKTLSLTQSLGLAPESYNGHLLAHISEIIFLSGCASGKGSCAWSARMIGQMVCVK